MERTSNPLDLTTRYVNVCLHRVDRIVILYDCGVNYYSNQWKKRKREKKRKQKCDDNNDGKLMTKSKMI